MAKNSKTGVMSRVKIKQHTNTVCYSQSMPTPGHDHPQEARGHLRDQSSQGWVPQILPEKAELIEMLEIQRHAMEQ